MNYSVGTKKGYFSFRATCFGALCHLPFTGEHVSKHPRGSSEYKEESKLLHSVLGEDFQFIDFPLTQFSEVWENATDNKSVAAILAHVESEILLLLNDLKIYKGIWEHIPEKHIIRVSCDHPYDQIMTLLFLIRNIVYYKDNAEVFAELRKRGYPPIVSAIVSHLVYINTSYWRGVTEAVGVRVGEYNWVNPHTFTKADFIRLVKQEDEINWFGEIWNKTKFGGYRRDHQFEEQGIIFRDHLVGDEYFEEEYDEYYDDDEEDENCAWNGKYYRLVDVLSSVTSEFIPPLSIQVNKNSGGFIVDNPCKVEVLLDALDQLLLEENLV